MSSLVAALAAVALAGAGDPLQGYSAARLGEFKEKTLAEHADLLAPIEGKDTFSIHPVEKIKVRVVYRGKARPLAGFRKEVVEAWCAQYFPRLGNDGFRREILVSDGERDQWILLQEQLWRSFEDEVRSGHPIELDLAFIGAAGGDWVFLANGFQVNSPGPDPATYGSAPELASRCDGGDRVACDGLAWRYEKGDGVARDLSAAARLGVRACDLGLARACLDAGNAFERGQGVARDDARAVVLYARACDGGEARGCAWLGDMLERGRGVPKDEAKAVGAWERGCNMGHVQACVDLGVHLMDGRGIGRDQKRGVGLFQAACEKGEATACALAGEAYLFGRPESREFGLSLIRNACERDPRACERLGRLQYAGEGVPKDLAAAATSFERACGSGAGSACRLLAEMYERGKGVARDRARARSTYDKACKLGCEDCCSRAR